MKRLLILGLVAFFAGTAQAEPEVSIEACNGVDALAIHRILDLEYQDTGSGALFVKLSCEGDVVTLRVHRTKTKERVLVVDLSALPRVAKPRTVALLIVQLSGELDAGLEMRSKDDEKEEEELEEESEEELEEEGADLPLESEAPGSVLLFAEEQSYRERPTKGKSSLRVQPVRFSAGLGYSMVSQHFTSDDSCEMCNYEIEIGAPSMQASAALQGRYGDRYLFAAALDYQYATSEIHMENDRGPLMVDTGYQLHRVHASAKAGYELDRSSKIAAFARTGVKQERLVIENKDFSTNAAKLPSETLSGLTVGASLHFSKLIPKAELGFTADMLMYGNLAQTAGLSDGIYSTIRAQYYGADLDYRWSRSVSLTWHYGYSRQETDWSGFDPTSLRDHQGDAARSDQVHSLFAGLSKSL